MKENGKQNFMPLYLFFGAIMALIVLPKLLMTLMMLGAGKALSALRDATDNGYLAKEVYANL